MTKKIYVIGSLKNPAIPPFANKLRALGFDVFDDWHYVGPDADDYWRTEEKARGRTYPEALAGASATNTFNFDKRHLDECDIGVMLMPAGKSAHLELGYLRGQGKPAYIVFDKEPERWDVMVKFATAVFFDWDKLASELIAEYVGSKSPSGLKPCGWNVTGKCVAGEWSPSRCRVQCNADTLP